MPAVEVERLVVRYGDTTAVDELSFTAEAGAVTVVLGPNGAGKTSTIECLEGYRRPAAGSLRVAGFDPVTRQHEVASRIGVMLQDGGVYTGIKPPEVLRLFAAYYDRPRDPETMLEMVGLGDRRRSTWRSLSGGEQQRLSLALALVGRPEVAFLDEPTAGVDLQGKQLIRSIVDDLRNEGVCVVLTTHDLDEAETLADRIVIVDKGIAVANGTPTELLSATDLGRFDFRARPGLPLDELRQLVGGAVTEAAPGEYRVDLDPTPAAVASIANWLASQGELIGDLRAGRQRLDDLFLRLTGEETIGGPRQARRRRAKADT